jgi:hypothetical protein
MYIPHLGASCKYQYLGEMAFVWKTPKDIEEDTVFRLKLTTDIPPTTHLSGRIRQSHADDSSSTSMQMEDLGIAGLSDDVSSSSAGLEHSEVAGLPVVNVACVALSVTFILILACWITVRLHRRRSQRVVLT